MLTPVKPDLTDWEISSGSAIAENGALILDANTTMWYKPFSSEESYAVEATFKCEKSNENPFAGILFNGTPDKPETLSLCLFSGAEVRAIDSRDRHVVKEQYSKNLCEDEVVIRLEVYPSQKRFFVFFNNRIFREAALNQEHDPKLFGGRAGLHCAGAKTTVTNISVGKIPDISDNYYSFKPIFNDSADYESIYPKAGRPADTIYKFIDPLSLSQDEQLCLMTLQGLVNRNQPRIYANYKDYSKDFKTDADWSKLLEEKGRAIVEVSSLDDLLIKFKDDYEGIVLGDAFCDRTYSYEPNMVTMLAAINDSVYMNAEIYARVGESLGKSVTYNTVNKWNNSLHAYRWAHENLFPLCNQRILAHLYCEDILHPTMPMRDYLVQNKIFCFYSSDAVTIDDYYFFLKIFASTPVNTPVIGMDQRASELKSGEGIFGEAFLFGDMASFGKYYIYTFTCANMSLLSGLETDELKQSKEPEIIFDPSKKYVTLMISDGDNFAWTMNNWISAYRDESRKDTAKTWGIPGCTYYLAPAILEWYYKNATPNDCFYLDGAGIGPILSLDIYALRYDEESRDKIINEYLKQTDFIMGKMDISVIKSWWARDKVSDESIKKYVKNVSRLKAFYTGYNTERILPLSDAAYMLDGLPVMHNTIVNTLPDKDAEINAARFGDSVNEVFASESVPAFAQAFILGNYIIADCQSITRMPKYLDKDTVIVRADTMARIYEEYIEGEKSK